MSLCHVRNTHGIINSRGNSASPAVYYAILRSVKKIQKMVCFYCERAVDYIKNARNGYAKRKFCEAH